MPNLIKKVLANVAQALTTAEKQQARDNIGAANSADVQTWKKLGGYTPMPTTPETSKVITRVGPFDIRYYADSQAALRLVIENMDIGDPHSVQVCSSGTTEIFNSLYHGDPQVLSIEFSNVTRRFNNIRLVVDYAEVYEISIQEIINDSARYLFYKFNG